MNQESLRLTMLFPSGDVVGGAEMSVGRLAPALMAKGVQVSAIVVGAPGSGVARYLGASIPTDEAATVLELRRLESARGDVLHVHSPTLTAWSPLALLFLRDRFGRVILTLHLPSYPPPRPRRRGQVRQIVAFGARGLLLRSLRVKVVAPSQSAATCSRRRFLGLGPRTQVLHNGVPDLGLRDPALRTSNEPLRVLTIGRLAPHKRPDVAVRAVAEAARPIELTIAGDGPLRSALDVLAETLEVDARFLGHVEDLAGTYARCHVVLLASESEGLPLVAMEAASAGRPVVADRSLDGMQEVLEGAMLPANDSSAEALARVLRRCFDDSDGLVTLGALARRRFDEFDMSLSGAADRFVETYRRR